jgi:hypothetical protein
MNIYDDWDFQQDPTAGNAYAYTSYNSQPPGCNVIPNIVGPMQGMSTAFFSYFAGIGVTENPNNPRNAVGTPPLSFTLSTASDCDAITQCA